MALCTNELMYLSSDTTAIWNGLVFRETGNVDFSVASADDLSAFKPKSFDAVTMSYVLMLPGPAQ